MKSNRGSHNYFAVFAAICLIAPSVSIAEIIGLDCSINAAGGKEFRAEFIVDMENRVAEVTKTNSDEELVESLTALEVVVAPRDITISEGRNAHRSSRPTVWTISREDLSVERRAHFSGRDILHSGTCDRFEPNVKNAF